MARKRPAPYELSITSLSIDFKGVANHQDKTVLVDGALAGERLIVQCYQKRGIKQLARIVDILEAAALRIQPKCAVFDVCGGCVLQHISINTQLTIKQQALADYFDHYAGVAINDWLEPITASAWGYRHKARLAVRFVDKKDTLLIGFREQYSGFVTQMQYCEVLHQKVAGLLTAMQQCLSTLSVRRSIPQIEVAVDEEATTVLILRHLEPLTNSDIKQLQQFSKTHDIHWQLQAKGLDSIMPLPDEATPVLRYQHPQHQVMIHFLASDFTQVNFAINRQMVNQALKLLSINKNDTVLDLFCGLGNFSLPLARYAQSVVGVDFSESLLTRARQNAQRNQLANVEFFAFDLSANPSDEVWYRQGQYSKALIDPARSGASEIIEHLPLLGVNTLLYVSCNPLTLARDTKKLIDLGYSLSCVGMIDMFTHTAHIESMALFTKNDTH